MYLLDTNHCSRLIDGHPALVRKLRELRHVTVATCVIVRGELTFMAERSERKAENTAKVDALLADMVVFPADETTADAYGQLKARLLAAFGPKDRAARRRFRLGQLGFADNDLWVAAIAKRQGFTVVSADAGFDRMKDVAGLRVERWWSPEMDRRS